MTASNASQPAGSLSQADLLRLCELISGGVTSPADADYERHRRVWNGLVDRFPAAIAHCATHTDVITALSFARDHGLPVAVRGGGHSVAGHSTCDGGIVVDLSPMKEIVVDPDQRTAKAGGGVTWGELDAATQRYGLATPGGVFSRTGIAGLTLGGGYGWLSSAFGLACDNLLAAEVVTADGRVVVAGDQDDEDAELLWGLRGGGGNFGVVTSFTYQLNALGPDVFFAFVFHDGEGEATEKILRGYRDFCAAAADQVTTIAVSGIVPADDMFPSATHGRRYVLLGGLYAGRPDEGEQILQPLRDLAQPLVDFSAVVPYLDVQKTWDADYPDGLRYYWKSLNLSSLDDDVIARIARNALLQSSPFSTTDLWQIGGAVRRRSPEHGAFNGLDAVVLMGLESNWENPDDDEVNIAWVRNFLADMAPYSDGSRYLNFAGFQEEGEQMMKTAFGPQYQRLLRLKQRYDPTNTFHLNQNIDPTGG